MATTDRDLTRRARAAYLRAGDTTHPKTAYVREHDGRRYVVLATRDVVLAVYRVRPWDNVLSRMRRPPRVLLSVADGPADTRTGQETP
jgi:hypothetical protein